jgi:hypothetical protein
MIKTLFFFVILIYSSILCAQDKSDNALLSGTGRLVYPGKDVSYIIVEEPRALTYERVGDFIYVYPKLFGSTRLILVKSNGESTSYFVDIGVNRLQQLGLDNGQNRTISGSLGLATTRSGNSRGLDNYSGFLGTTIWLTEHSFFKSTFLTNQNYSELNYAEYDYLDFYAKYLYFSDDKIGVRNYLYTPLRGYEVGYYKNGDNYSAWTGTDQVTKEDGFSGVYFRKVLDSKYYLGYGQNFYEDRAIPLFYFGYEAQSNQFTLDYSYLENQQLINPRLSHAFSPNWINLASISLDYAVAPNGSYGLTNSDSIVKTDTNLDINFANQQVDANDNPEYIPGYIYSNINYLYSTRYDFDSEALRYRLLYGMGDKITADGYLGYEKNNSLLSYERYYINPRLNIYIKGNKRHGIYLRTSYQNEYSKFTGYHDFDTTQQSTLGLYYNKYNFFVGFDVGSEIANIQKTETSSNFISVSSGTSVDAMTYNVGFYKTYNDTAHSDSLVAAVSYQSSASLFLRGRLTYKDQENSLSGIKSTDTNLFLSLTYLFAAGDKPINKQIYEKVSSLEGLVYLDKNLNGKQDSGEPSLSGVKISVPKQGDDNTTTDSNGIFKLKNFNKESSYTVAVEKEGYAPLNTPSINMTDYSQKMQIGLFAYYTKNIYFKGDLKLIDVAVRITCQGTDYEPHTELLSDRLTVNLPKDISCEIIPDFSRLDESYVAQVSQDDQKSITFLVQKATKFINFSLEGKKNKIMFEINGKSYPLTQTGEVSVIVNDFKGRGSLEVPKGCKISPEVNDFSFKNIKNNFFYKILCF